tara:strand:+ start:844 stop:1164 length:321 start_codon:yes stop_codon:yes gene_type:complete
MNKENRMPADNWPREPLTFTFYMLAGVITAEGGERHHVQVLDDIVSTYRHIEIFDVDDLEIIYFAFVRNYKVIKETLSPEAHNEFSAIYKAISSQYFKLKIKQNEK